MEKSYGFLRKSSLLYDTSSPRKYQKIEYSKQHPRYKSLISTKHALRILEEAYGLFIEGHCKSVQALAISNDNTYFVSGSADYTIRV